MEQGGEGWWVPAGAENSCLMVLVILTPPPQGVITVKGLVDREKGDFYTLTVVADDGGPKVDSTVVSRSRVTAPPRPSAPQHLTCGWSQGSFRTTWPDAWAKTSWAVGGKYQAR